MTDETLGDIGSVSSETQQQAVPVENVIQETQANVSTGNVDDSPSSQEEMLTLTDVNNRIAGAKRKAYEKGLKAARAQQPEQVQQSVATNNSSAGLDDSRISSMIESKMADIAKQQQEKLVMDNHRDEANRIISELTSKTEVAKQNIPGYEAAMTAVNNFNDVPAILASVYSLDNAGEVLFHLSQNLKDIPAINALAQTYQGRPGEVNLGASELKKISDRLKQNANGKQSTNAPEPVSKIETNTRDGMGDGTPKSIADYKHMYIG